MLAIINQYSHGYVTVPVVVACRRHGLFTALEDGPCSFGDLVHVTGANAGHLRVALRLLESLGWLQREEDHYSALPAADAHRAIPEDIFELSRFPFSSWVAGPDRRLLPWLERSRQGWGIAQADLVNYVDGMLMIPLLLALSETGQLDADAPVLLGTLRQPARDALLALFEAKGWVAREGDDRQLTSAGRFIVTKIWNTATLASYRPMLGRIDEVIFGDSDIVFRSDAKKHETHVDRTMNVRGSGFQHQKYFADMQAAVRDIFNREPFAEQPHYVADMGCGDGSLLRRIHQVITTETKRGQVLDQYPLKLIGIDFNVKALEETARTLGGLDHITLHGDVGDPAAMIEALRGLGIDDPASILHVRTFLDHDRPYLTPVSPVDAEQCAGLAEGVYVGAAGREIAPPAVYQSLVEHFTRWSGVIGGHGLLTLEVHCLDAATVRRYPDGESLHFDAYHAFSRQLLMHADTYLMAAAQAGLFPREDFARKYPKGLPFARITLNYFQRRPYRVRLARGADLAALAQLERACWPDGLRTADETLARRIACYPQGQLVLEQDGKVLGAIYTQRIASKESIRGVAMTEIDDCHDAAGTVVQLLCLNVLPSAQDQALGDQLLEFMLQRCALLGDVRVVVGVTRCKDFGEHLGMDFERYIGLKNAQGFLVDTVLRFHQLHGASITEVVPGYRPSDAVNHGCGALVEYDLQRRRRLRPAAVVPKAAASLDVERLRETVLGAVAALLDGGGAADAAPDRPLMEMGLDSADLLELNQRLSLELGVALDATFFFKHNTCDKIIAQLTARLDAVPALVIAATPVVAAAPEAPLAPEPVAEDAIAIVGIACRLPGGIDHPDQLWTLLRNGGEVIGPLPTGRWQWPASISPQGEHAGIDRGGFLADIAGFDPAFFRLSPKEAESMDPQQRLLLELAWHCLEDAGYAAGLLAGSDTGVYVGASGSDYQALLAKAAPEGGVHFGAATAMAALPNRLSYFFDFHGPSLLIDTACSSSLVATHEAIQALRRGACGLALVGGVNIMCQPDNTIAYQRAGMLAKDGRCKTFDQSADGYVRSEGAVMMLLKPLDAALRDGDAIHALLRGSAVNHGGQAGGLTVPNPVRQADLVVAALQDARVAPDSLQYIEAHGTGTALGDPIEVEGLKAAFARLSAHDPVIDQPRCGLGSVKTNLGHLEAAAGLAGLLKAVLSLQHRLLPATRNFRALNPKIALQGSPFFITDGERAWPEPAGGRRRAGVSSFGSGGTNAHVIVEEWPARSAPVRPVTGPALIVLSARDFEGLRRQAAQLSQALTAGRFDDEDLPAIAYTLQVGREPMTARFAAAVTSLATLQNLLQRLANGERDIAGAQCGEVKRESAQVGSAEATGALAQGHGEHALQHWVRGGAIDWRRWHGTGRPRLLRLPGYAFAKRHCWFGAGRDRASIAAPVVVPSAPQATGVVLQSLSPLPMVVTPTEQGGAEAVQLPPAEQLRAELTASLAEALYLDTAELDADKPFVELGLDSIVGVEWVRGINRRYGLSMAAARLYDHPTVRALAAYLGSAGAPAAAMAAVPPAAIALAPMAIDEAAPSVVVVLPSLLAALTASLAEALYLEPADIDVDKPFVEMGVDSIIGVEWVRALNQRYGVSIAATQVYDHPTVRAFTSFLAGELTRQAAAVPQSVQLTRHAIPEPHAASAPAANREPPLMISVSSPLNESAGEAALAEDVIAIVGIAGRYPGAEDLTAYWNNLAQGRNSVREIPAERWDVARYFDPRPGQRDKIYCKWLGALDDIDRFDPLFFGISPAEAELMDPQQRLFLQEAYRAFEDAGYDPQGRGESRCGVYLGLMSSEYAQWLLRHGRGGSDTTGNSAAIAAARIAYHLNLKGPALSVDTACSSSLVATHLACQALRSGEIDMALAGGVTLYLMPESYLGMCGAGMLSPAGQCKAMDNSADGFVPGEGVGVLVLKRLHDAQRDGDRIYATIVGSGINQDGKTNGITAPNVKSQVALERAVYARYGIDPDTISYVELHGTGTKLGDPIELEALATVFGERTQRRQFCALGSVKSNIGHTSAAAGVAGVQKVLLSLQHGELVPTLHYRTPNEHFDFANSPFYVNTERRAWRAEAGQPRRAAVSSFGFSGTNAHLVLEEYRGAAVRPAAPGPVLLVLSAKNGERLREQARRLHGYLSAQTDVDLAAVAYTLQVGREALPHRLAFVAPTVAELLAILQSFIERGSAPAIHVGQVGKDRNGVGLFEADDDAQELLRTWMRRRKLDKLAELWSRGLAIDWSKLYDAPPQRLSLPGYPFASERHWVEPAVATAGGFAALHPLLQRNSSTLACQRFSSTFSGTEPFLVDHCLRGVPVLPAAAQLEMARAALVEAEAFASDWALQRIEWPAPLMMDGAPVTVHIALTPASADAVDFEIYSECGGERVVHARGAAAPAASAAVPAWDLAALRARCKQRFDAERCYAAFAARGIDYGASHRGLTEVVVGRLAEGAIFALAPLRLPAVEGDYRLPPGLLDSALQASVGLLLAEDSAAPVGLPFTLGALQLLRDCPAEPVAVVRETGQQLDIDLCDENGAVCVRLQGFRTRPAQLKEIVSSERPAVVASDATDEMELLLLAPVFEAAPLPATTPVPAQRQLLFVCAAERYAAYQAALSAQAMQCDWLLHGAEGRSAAQRYSEATAALFDTVQGVLQSKPTEAVLLQVVVEEDGTPWAGLAGLLKSAAQENPQLIVQWLGVAAEAPVATVLAQLQAEAGQRSEPVVRYRDGARQCETLTRLPQPAQAPVFRADGVYLITGGLGGLGRQFAAAVAAAGATVVLSGRSALDAAGEAVLAALRAQGARAVDYQRADVTDRAAVEALIRGIESRHGGLHGIVHAAGLLRDGFLLKKNRAELAAVLAPKVAGTLHLDAATRYLPLDFLVLCSSLAGALGNVGQGDYAAANAFMDAFAAQRNTQVAAGERSGRTVSINWPLWADGGMQVDTAQREQLRRRGLRELSSAAGVTALAQALATGRDQVVLLAGVASQLAQLPLTQLLSGTVAPAAQVAVETEAADPQLREQALRHFRQLLGQTLKLAPHQLEADAEFEQYGIDSIKVMQLNGALEQQFGALPKTLFFEYQTLTELVDYFLRAHRPALRAVLQGGPQMAQALPAMPAPSAPRRMTRRERWASAVQSQPQPQAAGGPLDIAIIGLAGRYPQAPDLETFWTNLREGRDCISEVPAERWDHDAYFDAEKGKPGKTYSKWGGFIDGVDHFDPQFFNISPRDAEAMDPQERLFLQCAHAALEEAGYTRDTLGRRRHRFGLTGSVGVFVGVMYEEYQLYAAQAQLLGKPVVVSGNPSSIANRVSYFCNFHGPSIALDTMCSSSLTALHLACQSLARGECEAAIAGGVNVSVHPSKYLSIGNAKFASSKGRCESFGAGGDGYVPGEGVGAVLLKPLADAVADGDHIHGVIKATAVNHGGRTNGYTVPNPNAQGAVIAQTLAAAGIDARLVSYVEAHGTGTALGDPIEIAGLMKAFAPHTQDRQFCAIGSVKSNIGHCESAAGIAGLTKVLLQMKHGTLVPSLHAQTLNPNLDLANSPFLVQRELAEWRRPLLSQDGGAQEYPRIAGLSSFGAGGSNAHLIVEEYTAAEADVAAVDQPNVFVLSARTEAQLRQYAQRLLHAVQSANWRAGDLRHIAYTLQMGREALASRLAIVATSVEQLADALNAFIDGAVVDGIHHATLDEARVDRVDDGAAARLEAAQARCDGDALAALWVAGTAIDWSCLYRDGAPPRRVSLPTYPFEEKRYWPCAIEALAKPSDAAPADLIEASHSHKPSGIALSVLPVIATPPVVVSAARKPEEGGLEAVLQAVYQGTVSVAEAGALLDTEAGGLAKALP